MFQTDGPLFEPNFGSWSDDFPPGELSCILGPKDFPEGRAGPDIFNAVASHTVLVVFRC